MKRIHKYSVPPDQLSDFVTVEMPDRAVILSVGNQYENLCFWAIVDPERAKSPRVFRVAGTGHPLEKEGQIVDRLKFLGRVDFANGGLVFHVFEVEKE